MTVHFEIELSDKKLEVYPYIVVSSDSYNGFSEPEDVPPCSKLTILTIVFDLDETLVDATSENNVYVRPYARNILEKLSCFSNLEMILWSAGSASHVAYCLKLLDPSRKYFKYVISRGSWTSKRVKNICLLKDRHNSCILVDNTPECVGELDFPSIIVPDFRNHFKNSLYDTTLLYVFKILEDIYKLFEKINSQMELLNSESEDSLFDLGDIFVDFDLKNFISTHPFIYRFKRNSSGANFNYDRLFVNGMK